MYPTHFELRKQKENTARVILPSTIDNLDSEINTSERVGAVVPAESRRVVLVEAVAFRRGGARTRHAL